MHRGQDGELEQGGRKALTERKHKGSVMAKQFLHGIL